MGIFDELKKRYSQRINEAKSAVNYVKQIPSNFNYGMRTIAQNRQPVMTNQQKGQLSNQRFSNLMPKIESAYNKTQKFVAPIASRAMLNSNPITRNVTPFLNKDTYTGSKQLVKDTLRNTPRAINSLVISTPQFKMDQFTPTTKAEKIFYGDQPIKPVQTSWTAEQLKKRGVNSKVATGVQAGVNALGIIGDVTGATGLLKLGKQGVKQAVKEVAPRFSNELATATGKVSFGERLNNAKLDIHDDVANLLVRTNNYKSFKNHVAEKYGDKIAKGKLTEFADDLWGKKGSPTYMADRLRSLDETPITGVKIKKYWENPDGTKKGFVNFNEPLGNDLSNEARKYKSAEEFVRSQIKPTPSYREYVNMGNTPEKAVELYNKQVVANTDRIKELQKIYKKANNIKNVKLTPEQKFQKRVGEMFSEKPNFNQSLSTTPKATQGGGKVTTKLTQADLDELQYGVAKTKPTEPVKVIPEMPSNTKSFKTTDIQGNPQEQVLFRKTESKLTEPAKNKLFNEMPEYNGWKKVFKPYGEQGAGFYYTREGVANTQTKMRTPNSSRLSHQTNLESNQLSSYNNNIPKNGQNSNITPPKPPVEPPMGGTPEMPKKPQGKERGFSKTFAKTENLPKELQGKKLTYNPITNEETLKTAQTQLDVEKFVKSNYDQAKKRVMSGEMTPENNMLSQELIRRNIAEGKFDEVDEIFNKLAEKGTTGGQFIQSFAAWSKTTPEGMLKYAKSTVDKANSELGSISKGIRGVFGKGTPKIDESDAKFITDTMKKAQGLPEAEKLPLIQSVFDRINKKIPWGVSDVLDTYRYNNMLSNPLTHLRNAVSNIVQTSITRPATLLAQGKGKQALQYEMGTLKALPDAVDGFIKAMKKPGQLGRLDEPMKLKPRLLGRWNTPSDLMEAGDVFFRKLIESGETARGATKADAARIGEYSLFRAPLNDKQQGALLNKIDDVTKATYNLRKVGLGWFIPFIRTPMNVAKQWVEYSPAGFSTMVGASNKGEQAAKAVIGSLITMAGANLALQGRTTWDAPTDPKEKELFYASGRKPFSVKIKDKWVPMQTFGAYAFALGLPAAAKYYQTESRTALTDDDISKWAKIATSGLNFWSGQTFVSGLGNFVDLVQGDQDWKLSRVVAQPLTQLKPMTGALSYISRLVDPVFRKASGFTDQLKSGVPGLTKGMEAYTNPFGEESRRNITDFVAPYSMGQADPRFEQQLKDRTKTLQENNLINMMKKGKDVEVKTGQLSDGLYQRSNGKVYSQKLDKEFDTRDEADQAVAKEDFKKSGANFKDMGKYVLRKKEDGEPQVMPKGEYMFKINNVKLDNAKKAKNLKEWNKLAQKKLGYLTYKLNDPSVDELDKLEFQKDIDALSIEMIKFGAYGGFTKPKKAKKAKQLKLATSAIRPPSLPSLRSSVSSVNIPKLSISKIGGGSVQTGRPRSLRTKRYAA